MPAPAHFESWQPEFQTGARRIVVTDTGGTKGSGSGMVLGGIGGTLIGWLVGGVVGNLVSDWDSGNGPVYGAMVGASVGIPLGVHMGNHGQGNLLNDLLVSAGIGAAGIAVTSASENWLGILLTPLAQVIVTIAMEDHDVRKAAAQDASQ